MTELEINAAKYTSPDALAGSPKACAAFQMSAQLEPVPMPEPAYEAPEINVDLTQIENATLLQDVEMQAGGSILSGLISAGCKMADDVSGVTASLQKPMVVQAQGQEPAAAVNHYNPDYTMSPTPGGMAT